jgi:hypothetical protein
MLSALPTLLVVVTTAFIAVTTFNHFKSRRRYRVEFIRLANATPFHDSPNDSSDPSESDFRWETMSNSEPR